MSQSEPTAEEEVLVKKRARALFATGLGIGAFVLWMMISSTLDMVSAYQSYDGRKTIIDCVTPTGECYIRNQTETGKVVEQLIREGAIREIETRATIIASVWCDDQPGINNLEQLEVCVKDQLRLREGDRGDG